MKGFPFACWPDKVRDVDRHAYVFACGEANMDAQPEIINIQVKEHIYCVNF